MNAFAEGLSNLLMRRSHRRHRGSRATLCNSSLAPLSNSDPSTGALLGNHRHGLNSGPTRFAETPRGHCLDMILLPMCVEPRDATRVQETPCGHFLIMTILRMCFGATWVQETPCVHLQIMKILLMCVDPTWVQEAPCGSLIAVLIILPLFVFKSLGDAMQHCKRLHFQCGWWSDARVGSTLLETKRGPPITEHLSQNG